MLKKYFHFLKMLKNGICVMEHTKMKNIVIFTMLYQKMADLLVQHFVFFLFAYISFFCIVLINQLHI